MKRNLHRSNSQSTCLLLFAWLALASCCLAAEPIYKPLKGGCYGPFREGQDPTLGIYPSEAQVKDDIARLKNIVPKIRTYGTENILYRIPEFCKDAGLYCYPGAWVDEVAGDAAQLTNLVGIGILNYATTKALVVGNEYLYRHGANEAKLIGWLREVKAATGGKPVAASEQWHIWRDHPNLVPEVDVILIHVHPYWESQDITNAANFVLSKYNYIKGLYPAKTVIISETGWPSQGPAYGAAVPGEANHKKFVKDFVSLAASNNIDYLFFEIFDEPWKGEGGVGAWWGAFYKDRTMKPGMQSIVSNNFNISSIAVSGDAVSLNASTFEGNIYKVEKSPSAAPVAWTPLTNFLGAPGTNLTRTNLLTQSGTGAFYRVRTSF
ncbi:MAG: hypothetical protein C0404_09690 [Verrucomicrobia bacterium]|nr:hypothetical protein [Verrucomicrobiota bacterium]